MAATHHDRLDTLLSVLEFTDAPCGSLNLRTGQAEYCGFNCPTLKQRMLTDGDDPGRPLNGGDGLKYVPFDPASV